jgi:prophage regulatory protein
MIDRLLSVREVAAAVGITRSTIYARIAAGTFPAPRRVGPGTVRWRESDIQAWIDALPSAREAA